MQSGSCMHSTISFAYNIPVNKMKGSGVMRKGGSLSYVLALCYLFLQESVVGTLGACLFRIKLPQLSTERLGGPISAVNSYECDQKGWRTEDRIVGL